MRVHVVSDVHGNAEALARAGDGADALLVLGDLIDFVDYQDYSGGILGMAFGRDATAHFALLRARGERGEAGRYLRELWEGIDAPDKLLAHTVREQYARLFGKLSAPTYATPGNVDSPEIWGEFAATGLHHLDGSTVSIGGLRFGFLGGVPLPAGAGPVRGWPWRPYLRQAAEYGEALRGLGPVEVLCTHVPPDLAELTYDVVARNAELGSPDCRAYIERAHPWMSLFGHVHQPLARRLRWRRTECVNVGHFKRTEQPFVLEW